MAQYAHLSQPDAEWADATQGSPDVAAVEFPEDLTELRIQTNAHIIAMIGKGDPPITAGLVVMDKGLPVGENTITMRTYVPLWDSSLGEDESTRFPILVWVYGGGFFVGTLDIDDTLLRALTVKLRVSCISADYRKIPEYPFPTPLDDMYACFKWAVSNPCELLADPSKGLIVGGASAGGCLAAGIVYKASKDNNLLVKVTGQLLIMPMLVASFAHPEKFKPELLSMEQNSNAPFCTAKSLAHLGKLYYGSHTANPEASPLLASSFESQPPTYFQICGMDPLRDEAFLYNKLLQESGVHTRVDIYPGLPHGFHYHHPEFKASQKRHKDLIEGLNWLLNRKM